MSSVQVETIRGSSVLLVFENMREQSSRLDGRKIALMQSEELASELVFVRKRESDRE